MRMLMMAFSAGQYEDIEKPGDYEMKDQDKTKQQLINELKALRQEMAKPEGLGVERKQAEGRLDKEFAAITSVVDDMLRGEIDDKETEKRVLDACLTVTDSAYGQIGVINEHGKYDTTTYSGQTLQDCAFPEALAWEMSTGMTIRGIWGWPMLHGEPLLCNDLPAHPDSVGFPKGHAPLQCFLGVPLKRDGEVVGIADCHSLIYMYWESTEKNLCKAEEASRKALELDPDVAEAHAAHGLAISLSQEYAEAGKEFEAAIRLNPRLFEAHYFYARTCLQQGKLEKAAQLFKDACAVRPEDYQAPTFMAQTYEGDWAGRPRGRRPASKALRSSKNMWN